MKTRLDVALFERGLAKSREEARALVLAGQVYLSEVKAEKAGQFVTEETQIIVRGDTCPYVSRGGYKLQKAMESFPITLDGKTCADIGASTGGFTDCMLQRGAAKVYAIDVGKGILHWKLRNYARVVVMEETNARHVESLPEKVSFVTVDASFISLKILLPVVKKWFNFFPPASLDEGKQKEERTILALIKPQFEAGRKDVSRGDGVIRDPEIHKQVLQDVLSFAKQEGFGLLGLIKSPLLGPKGNAEFLVWLDLHSEGKSVEELVNGVMEKEIAASGE